MKKSRQKITEPLYHGIDRSNLHEDEWTKKSQNPCVTE